VHVGRIYFVDIATRPAWFLSTSGIRYGRLRPQRARGDEASCGGSGEGGVGDVD